jgi:hypothetical protein
MAFHRLNTNDGLIRVVNIRSVSELHYENYGDAHARDFYDEWLVRTLRLGFREEYYVLLETELYKSDGFEPDMKYWYRTVRPSDRTYDALLEEFHKWIVSDEQRAQNRRELKHATEKANPHLRIQNFPTDGGSGGAQQSRKSMKRAAAAQKKADALSVAASVLADTKGKGKGESLCFRCKKPGHLARDCSLPWTPRPEEAKPSAAKREKTPKGAGTKGGGQPAGKPGSSGEICRNHQSEYNGGKSCIHGDACIHLHTLVDSQETFSGDAPDAPNRRRR